MSHKANKGIGLGLLIGSLGVVYGDIGTSPLYAMTEAFFGHYPLARTTENVFGVVSLVFWSLVLVVAVKYVGFILRATNHGEGGTFALLGLLLRSERGEEGVRRSVFSPRMRAVLFAAILVGAALLYGDGMITPAISVLSAVEGISIVTPSAEHFVVPATLLILVILFAVQHKGTHRIGWVFGPIMTVWFLAIAALGMVQVVQQPEILRGLNPLWAVRMAVDHGWHVMFVMGAVVLCVTGVEAMYADVGHFGRPAIVRSWLMLVAPCLLLNYLGQGAFMLSGQPVPGDHLFYALAPGPLLIPMVILATVATIIASQALISGAFSLTQQAIAMGLFPRVKIVHTNPDMPGQIYLPAVNWILLLGCLWLVVSFRSSGALAAAYGIAVTGTMIVTTLVFLVVAKAVFGWRRRWLVPILTPILLMDFAFFGANLLKLKEGGYVPILIGLAVFTIMDTWRWGRAWIGRAYQARMQELPLTVGEIVANTPAVAGGPGSISLVVMASRPITSLDDTVPPVMAQHYANWRRLPKHIIFMSIVQTNSPFVPEEERYATTTFRRDADGTVVAVQARYGYMEQPNVRLALAEMKQGKMIKLPLDPRRWLILIGSERFITPGRNLREKIRIGLFSRMNRLAKPVTDYFGLETDSAVTMEAINV